LRFGVFSLCLELSNSDEQVEAILFLLDEFLGQLNWRIWLFHRLLHLL